jgi:hypothetical protein
LYPITGVFLEFHDCEIRIAEMAPSGKAVRSGLSMADAAARGRDADRIFTAVLRNPGLPPACWGMELEGRFAKISGRLFTGMAIPQNFLAGPPIGRYHHVPDPSV